MCRQLLNPMESYEFKSYLFKICRLRKFNPGLKPGARARGPGPGLGAQARGPGPGPEAQARGPGPGPGPRARVACVWPFLFCWGPADLLAHNFFPDRKLAGKWSDYNRLS